MKKTSKYDTFRNSSLDRATPSTRHRFHSFINNNFKRHRSDTGLVEDRTNSTVIVRIICGLLMIHLVIIGGVLVRGHLLKSNAGVAVAPTVTPPPAPTAAAAAEKPGEVSTGTVNMNVAPIVNPKNNVAVAPPAANAAPAEADDTAEEVTPAAPAAPAAPATVTVKHLVHSGDTWGTVAAQYGTTEAALKSANPKAAKKANLFQGTYLAVPVAADSERGKAAAAHQQAAAEVAKGKVYTVGKGDSLGKIARKHKISVDKLRALNGLTPADDKRIKPGMELKVAE